MANIYLLDSTPTGIRAVFHYDIPAGSNTAGMTYQQAYVQLKTGLAAGTIASVLPDGNDTNGTIGATEKTAVNNGARVEETVTIELPGDWVSRTGPQKAAIVDAKYNDFGPKLRQALKDRLEFYGLTR
jgi:hypothetical protein